VTGKRAKTGADDLVSDLDLDAQRRLIAGIRSSSPGDAIRAEELDADIDGHPDRVWIVDPVDGSLNLICSLGLWAIGMCLRVDERVVRSVVDIPLIDETLAATAETGVFVNGWLQPPAPHGPSLAQSRVETVLTSHVWRERPAALGEFNASVGHLRWGGSSLTALASVAAVVEGPDGQPSRRLHAFVAPRSGKDWDWYPCERLVLSSGGMVAEIGPFRYAADSSVEQELQTFLERVS
jgi:fructose-1,6-bisphosphatase/inositol monophosphatase family enzyme